MKAYTLHGYVNTFNNKNYFEENTYITASHKKALITMIEKKAEFAFSRVTKYKIYPFEQYANYFIFECKMKNECSKYIISINNGI